MGTNDFLHLSQKGYGEHDFFPWKWKHLGIVPKGSFPIEKATKLGNLAFRGGGGSSKNQKSPKFQLGKVQN